MKLTEVEKGIKRLDKTIYYVVSKKLNNLWITRDDRTKEYQDYYTVIFLQKEKVKLGSLRLPYSIRYGIDVHATYQGHSNWWFFRAGAASTHEMDLMQHLYDNGAFDLMETFKFADHKDKIDW